MDFVICECTPLTDTLIFCSPVRLSDTDLDAVYIGTSGVFAVMGDRGDPEALYFSLSSFFSTSRIEVYHAEKGRYNASGKCSSPFPSEQELDAAIYVFTTQGDPVWNAEALDTWQQKIRILDGRNRGIYRDDENNWFIQRNGSFYPLSPCDSNQVLLFTLFGGVFGLHRIAIGKSFSGIAYLLTCGLMGIGWLLDLVQLCTGTMRDSKKRLLARPSRRHISWYLAGLLANLALMLIYVVAAGLFSRAMGWLILDQLNGVNIALAATEAMYG